MKNKLIAQDNALTTARYEMTAIEKNIMYSLMSQIEDTDAPSKYYKISSMNIYDNNDRRLKNGEFEKAIQRLLTRDIAIKKSDGNILQITIISSAEYHANGSVEIGIDLKMRPYLFALKNNFTRFDLDTAMSLNSKYAKRLYEMLCQFRSTGLLRISVNELKDRLQLVDNNGIEQYARWSSFENNVLKTAQNEINQKADFKIDYDLRKEGRKITNIDFFFRKILSPVVPPLTQVVHPQSIAPSVQITELTEEQLRYNRMKERLTEFGLIPSQISNVLKKQTEQVVNKALYNLTCDRDSVKNTAAYLLKIFEVS